MRSTLLLSAVLALAVSTAAANDRVVQANIFDQATPNCQLVSNQRHVARAAFTDGGANCAQPGCASAGCAAPGCAEPACGVDAGCAAPSCEGCAGACGGCSSDCESSSCDTDCPTCDAAGCKGCGGCGGACKGAKCRATLAGEGKCNVCNMPQHLMYHPVDHGYYYFRPYNYRHIRQHQDAVVAWGGDPRNPYSNEIFKTIYAEAAPQMMDQRWEDVPVQMPPAPSPVAPQAQEVVPMPVPTPTIDPSARVKSIGELRLISNNR